MSRSTEHMYTCKYAIFKLLNNMNKEYRIKALDDMNAT